MLHGNICFFSGDITRSGGTERVTSVIINNLYKLERYTISILSLEMVNNEPFFFINKEVRLESLYKKGNNFSKNPIRTIVKLRHYIKSRKIDVLIDIDTILDVFSVPATRYTKTKLIAWEHFNYYENLGVKYRDWGRKLSARFADAIVTITKEDKQYLKKELNPKCPIYQIYNPIDIQERSNPYSVESKIILSAGRLTYQKGFDLLVDIAEIVLKKYFDWKWIILGEGKDRQQIEDKINNSGLQNHVILKGNVKNINEFYNQASIFVLTSRYEGFGLVLTEAKSFKLPCVSFACKAGPSEIIEDGVNGFLVECFNMEKMANRIMTLIESKDLRLEFSKCALFETERFSINTVIEEWGKIIDSILRK
ncbi:glycosyltransferase family 4 protein [Proteiniphilum acetatigenes]|uniref:glycosyltransferase family 4 protein n=1 Tax=Proteiniphilum acetatigenes TaxID=294710 RepID=UPI00036095FA|nr:glycosyltransferase family 4 protein [Proteiniphilum acetatigenes]SFL31949.1 Glycosyltransferase involved in cell wall bisynthesis [Porphyromonadaceae bacterium KH3CP3RA]